jgi:flagellar M-ring protein FliF
MPALLQQMSPKGRIVLGASAVGILVVAFLMFRVATAPSYSTMMTGLDPAKVGQITAALDEKGIAYELQNNGTALAVEKAQTGAARVALAEGGVSGGGAGSEQPGYELLKDQKLGASDFQQRITYQRALEGELARTVDQIEGVNGAEVQLTLPEDELFADEKKPATAAVLLGGAASPLDAGSVRGVANLVSSSVENLKTENVTITDSTGRMLWPQNEPGSAGAATASKTVAEAKYANELESSLNALLMRTVGPDKAQVKVKADLDVDQVKEKQLRFARRGTPAEEVVETEELEGQGAGAAGAGTRANIPTYQAAGGAGGASNYNKESRTTKFNVDRTVTDSVRAPGTVNRLDVALVLDNKFKPAERAELEKAIAGAAGIQRDRGDTITTSQLAFAKAPETKEASTGPVPAGTADVAKYAGLGLASLIFLFFVGRHLRKREDEALMGEPMWLRQIEAPQSLSELEAAQAAAPGAHGPQAADQRKKVEEAVRKEPERVAAQVRNWLSEDL